MRVARCNGAIGVVADGEDGWNLSRGLDGCREGKVVDSVDWSEVGGIIGDSDLDEVELEVGVGGGGAERKLLTNVQPSNGTWLVEDSFHAEEILEDRITHIELRLSIRRPRPIKYFDGDFRLSNSEWRSSSLNDSFVSNKYG